MASFLKSAESSGSSLIVKKINSSVYELSKPVGKPSIQVVFFHGLQPGGDYSEAHLSTWQSEDGTCCWLQTWLVDKIPGIHVFSVSCSGCLEKNSNQNFDLFLQAENLISDILNANIGQEPFCPLVLVGHSIGGLIIKELCCQVYRKLGIGESFEKIKREKFINNLKGIFYYATPHLGSPVANRLADIKGRPVMKYFKQLSTEVARLNDEFGPICKLHKWQSAGLGEGRLTNLGHFKDVMVVPEASARGEGGDFNQVDEDQFSICRPKDKTSRTFLKLTDFLAHKRDTRQMKGFNFETLPKSLKGIDFQLMEVQSKLQSINAVGLVGMGGLGKTTLAKAVFNALCLDFEYTCFVPNMQQRKGQKDEIMEQMWKYMHQNGRKVGNEVDWFKLKGEHLLLILDDIAGYRDVPILQEIIDNSSIESRFIVTSRERESLKNIVTSREGESLKKILLFDVQLLEENNAKELFMSHAFPNGVDPSTKLANLMTDVVKKCDGLPLTLEVLGEYLNGEEQVEVWEETLSALTKAEEVGTLNERLWTKLELSYKGLGEKEKKMFLDATTMFSGKDSSYLTCTLRDAKAAWRVVYNTHSESLLWQTLVNRCLVYNVQDDDRIQIHDQLQSLGRKIAESTNECRVWDQTVALELLQTTDESDNKEIHALQLSNRTLAAYGSNRVLTSSHILRKLKKLRYLEVESDVILNRPREDGSFLSELVLLQCVGFQGFLPTLLSRLVVLKLTWSNEERLPSSVGELSALRIFMLYGNKSKIDSMPDEVGQLSQLEVLGFFGFEYLRYLPETLGQLTKLKDLKVIDCKCLEFLPKSFAKLSALLHLEFVNCGLQSLPESALQLAKLKYLKISDRFGSIKKLPDSLAALNDLQSLELGSVPFVTILPSWLKDTGVTLRELSYKGFHFQKQSGRFSVIRELIFDAEKLMDFLHSKELDKIRASDFEGVIVDYTACNLEVLDPQSQGFVLQERGIAKRFVRDLPGAEKDLTAALAVFKEAGYDPYMYHSLKHLGYVKFLNGDLEGAQKEGEMALKLLPIPCRFIQCLGETPVSYMHFRLKGSIGFEDQTLELCGALPNVSKKAFHFQKQNRRSFVTREERMFDAKEVVNSLYSRELAKIRALDFEGIIADYTACNLEVLDPEGQGFVLQERGIAKRFVGDLPGAEKDLTAALKVLREAGYDRYMYHIRKHLSYVRFLMGDLVGARKEGEMALKLLPVPGRFIQCLGETPVSYMHFRLKGSIGFEDQTLELYGALPKLSKKAFHVQKQNRRPSVTREELMVAAKDLMNSLHSRELAKIRASDFEGVITDYTACNLEVQDPQSQGFVLQERGIAKRFVGDLPGAEKDLIAALEVLREAGYDRYMYHSLKHLGYVRFLMGDMEGARKEGEMALKLLPVPCLFVQCLGETPVSYMDFRLKGSIGFEDQTLELCGSLPKLSKKAFQFQKQNRRSSVTREERMFDAKELMNSLHSSALAKIRASDFQGVIVDYTACNLEALDPEGQGFILQERGIAKRFVGDLRGAEKDLTTALEVFREAGYDRYTYHSRKHLAYVRFLMGDLEGSPMQGEMALKLLPVPCLFVQCLGEIPVSYLNFRLRGSTGFEDQTLELWLS